VDEMGLASSTKRPLKFNSKRSIKGELVSGGKC